VKQRLRSQFGAVEEAREDTSDWLGAGSAYPATEDMAQKKKTRRWERRVTFFIVIGVYGFNYAAWLRAVSHL
jgi:hypothetical protein